MKMTARQRADWARLNELLLPPERELSVSTKGELVVKVGDPDVEMKLDQVFNEIHLPEPLFSKGELVLPEPVAYIIAYRYLQGVSTQRETGGDHTNLLRTLVEGFEKKHLSDKFILEEIFYSFQGEGLDIGLMTTFIRTLGCDMKCVGCDTFYGEATPKTISNWKSERLTTAEILQQVEDFKAPTVCLTGGEPTLYYDKQIPLIAMLRARGYWITMQTNGKRLDSLICGLVQSVNLDIKPPSSGQEVRLNRIPYLRPEQQVKVLVGNEEDIEFALEVDRMLTISNPDVWLVLQPYIFNHEHNAQGVIEGLNNLYRLLDTHAHRFNSRMRLTLQSHKLIGAR